MTEDDSSYSHDTGAIRDVALSDIRNIIDDIALAQRAFESANEFAPSAMANSIIFGSFGGGALSFVREKWDRASVAVLAGMRISQERLDELSSALIRAADDYDDVDEQVAADLETLLRHVGARQVWG